MKKHTQPEEATKPLDIFDPVALEVLFDTRGAEEAAKLIRVRFDQLVAQQEAQTRKRLSDQYHSLGQRAKRMWSGVRAGFIVFTVIFGLTAICAAIWWGSVISGQHTAEANTAEMDACAQGDQVRCVEAVQNHFRDRDSTASPQEVKWHDDRIAILSLAYRKAAKQELPLLTR